MVVLFTCKNEEDPIKNEGARVFRRSRAANSAVHGQILSNFTLIQDFMVVLVTCKNEEYLINNEGARVFTILYINFSDAQGQITPKSVVVSGRNLN